MYLPKWEKLEMKAFISAVVVAFALERLDRSSAHVYQTKQGDVRL
jgi:hypothetical protein